MTATLSIVIPTLDAEKHLPRCLDSLIEGLTSGLIRDLVITDGGSQDATAEMAEAAGAVLVTGPASRGGQLRRGVEAARGDWLLVLHADTHLSPGWSQEVIDHIRDEGPTAHFRLSFREGGMMAGLVAGWANLRARLFALPYGDQGLLLRRSDYDEAGGYPDQPLMEDVALVRALGRPLARLDSRAITSAERYLRDGWIRRGLRNLWTMLRYRLGADPERLAAGYRR
ncbi:TIGR04283 family arsenosugar biosynthesis glycosyltransferase [Marinibacterium sp. SX1]|uniref:TIGR04283 family arsenosugar biosynthesis glycosyltransferase n=1 Tax=Marinibacterium sp. SX1 TaxID=3388424 RepID=UPI003D1662C3